MYDQVFPIGSGATLVALTVKRSGKVGDCERVITIGELQPESKERSGEVGWLYSWLMVTMGKQQDGGRGDCGVQLLGY